jgi:hypothetical protein
MGLGLNQGVTTAHAADVQKCNGSSSIWIKCNVSSSIWMTLIQHHSQRRSDRAKSTNPKFGVASCAATAHRSRCSVPTLCGRRRRQLEAQADGYTAMTHNRDGVTSTANRFFGGTGVPIASARGTTWRSSDKRPPRWRAEIIDTDPPYSPPRCPAASAFDVLAEHQDIGIR